MSIEDNIQNWFVVRDEMARAEQRYGDFTSSHEGYGVLAEEVAELLDAIRANDGDAIAKEALQVAAVALRLRHATLNNGPFRQRSNIRDVTAQDKSA